MKQKRTVRKHKIRQKKREGDLTEEAGGGRDGVAHGDQLQGLYVSMHV